MEKTENNKKLYRPDIDGLRAVAVIAVVMYHANFIPFISKGGYTGVDIFFVISGFLITGILLRNLGAKENPGKINLLDFYMRRIRRIFPALTVVLLAVIFFSILLLSPSEFRTIGYHVAAGAAYLSNFCLWHESGYFDFSSALKPLLHLWSLGVEEQFYIVWPLLLWIAYKLRFKLIYVTLAFTVGSFALCIYMIAYDPVQAFFAPWCRVWELSTGGTLACVLINRSANENSLKKSNARFADLASILGIVLLFSGFIGIRDDIAFPDYITLVPVLGATLVIYSGTNAVINRTFLSSKFMVFMGLISYPLYLWHWPLISFGNLMYPGKVPSLIRIVLVLSAVLLSYLTYRFIEPPLRYGNFPKAKSAGLLLGVLCIGVVGMTEYAKAEKIYSYLPWGNQEIANLVYQQEIVNQRLAASYECTNDFIKANNLNSKLASDVITLQAPWQEVDVALIGDSHAQHLLQGLVYSSAHHKYALISAPGEVPLLDVINPDLSVGIKESELIQERLSIYQQMIRLVGKNENIKTIILAHNPKYSQIRDVIALLSPNEQDKIKILTEGLKRTLDYFKKLGKNVVFVYDNPSFPVIIDKRVNICNPWRPFNKKGTEFCSISKSEWDAKKEQYPLYQALNFVLKDNTYLSNTQLIDLSAFFCDKEKCNLSSSNNMYYIDSNHLSISGSIKVAPRILQAIEDSVTH